MIDEPKDPAQKMRTLLKGGRTSPMTRLPKKKITPGSNYPQEGDQDQGPVKIGRIPTSKGKTQAIVQPAPPPKGRFSALGPPLWTIASVISLVVNAVLIILLAVMLVNFRRLDVNSALNLGSAFLGGLYENFEKMDRAHITSSIPVTTTIPVKFDLQLNQQTNVVLSQDVTIDNAVVTVKTGGLNITNALTTIVLPQGTSLPVVLNLNVPVDVSVPVVMNVPVDIPLDQTQLHEPFTGLQQVVRPFYCMVNAGAANLDGQPICK
jgi:hypothetical protein